MRNWFYGFLVLSLLGGGFWWYNQAQTSLPESVLRLHVIANSDSAADQALKLEVKNGVVAVMKPEFSATRDLQEARQLAEQKSTAIERAARQVVAAHGYDYPVQVAVGDFAFPTKAYGNLVLPQGEYTAVRVIIGEGQGQNWWCVLFPPLCMVSSSDRGLSLGRTPEAEISWKCLELLPKGAKIGPLPKVWPAQPDQQP